MSSCHRTRTHRQKPRGFTLIELMIVVSIIGILAAAASPVYIDYTIRGQIADGLSVVASAKIAVAEYFQEHGTYPADNTEAALPAPAEIDCSYVISVTVAGQLISVRYGNNANSHISGETIVLTADGTTGSLTWSCISGGVIQDKHLPKSCQ